MDGWGYSWVEGKRLDGWISISVTDFQAVSLRYRLLRPTFPPKSPVKPLNPAPPREPQASERGEAPAGASARSTHAGAGRRALDALTSHLAVVLDRRLEGVKTR